MLNTDQDGIWLGQSPGNFPDEWPQGMYCQTYRDKTHRPPKLSHKALLLFSKTTIPRMPWCYLILGMWGLQVNLGGSNTTLVFQPTLQGSRECTKERDLDNSNKKSVNLLLAIYL